MKSWNELTELEQLACTYSDVHKEATGFRPRYDVSAWTADDFKKAIDQLSEVAAQNAELEQAAEAAAAVKVEETITKLIGMGAADRNAAIRWLDEGEETNGDLDYLCYKLGLKYGYFGQCKTPACSV